MEQQSILLAATGLSPQVVTETLFALMQRGESFLPSRIKLLTTKEGASRARLQLLDPQSGKFHSFLKDFGLIGRIKFDSTDIEIIRNKSGEFMDDMMTPEDNICAADAITKVVRELTLDDSSKLHVSIAGGRKTLGFYMGYAFSLFARPQDTLSHVLVSSPFESNVDFFYPPPKGKGVVLYTNDKKPIHTDDAKVWLAEIPVVKLRNGISHNLLDKDLSFSEAVQLIEESYKKPNIVVQTINHELSVGGVSVPLTDIQLVIYTLIAQKTKESIPLQLDEQFIHSIVKTGQLFFPGQGEASDKLRMFDVSILGFDDVIKRLRSEVSKIKKSLYTYAPTVAIHYTIESTGRKAKTNYFVKINPSEITIIS